MTTCNGWAVWDRRYMAVAEQVASWSKDPNTKVGAVIVDLDGKIVATGYNGFPRGVKDLPERYDIQAVKYAYVVHAELNAILNATQCLNDTILYVTLSPCRECAKAIIQSGIKMVIYRDYRPDEATDTMFNEAQITMFDIKDSV
jgi:dCMP deaminase